MLQLLIISLHLGFKYAVVQKPNKSDKLFVVSNNAGTLNWVAIFSNQLAKVVEQYNFAQYRADIDLLML